MDPNIPRTTSSPNPIFGIVSLGLGIIGLCLMVPSFVIWLCSFLPLLFGIASVIVGILGITRISRDPVKYGGKTLAYVGTAVGILSVIAPVLWIIVSLLIFGYYASLR